MTEIKQPYIGQEVQGADGWYMILEILHGDESAGEYEVSIARAGHPTNTATNVWIGWSTHGQSWRIIE